MSVEFNEPEAIISSGRSKKASSLTQLVIGTGIVKTEAGAQFLLFILAVLSILGAGMLFVHANATPPAPVLEQVAR